MTWSFLEKLAAVRSLDKAFEVQTEFAKKVFETFLAESRKIQELHSAVARQRVVRLEGFVAGITQTTFVLRATIHSHGLGRAGGAVPPCGGTVSAPPPPNGVGPR